MQQSLPVNGEELQEVQLGCCGPSVNIVVEWDWICRAQGYKPILQTSPLNVYLGRARDNPEHNKAPFPIG